MLRLYSLYKVGLNFSSYIIPAQNDEFCLKIRVVLRFYETRLELGISLRLSVITYHTWQFVPPAV